MRAAQVTATAIQGRFNQNYFGPKYSDIRESQGPIDTQVLFQQGYHIGKFKFIGWSTIDWHFFFFFLQKIWEAGQRSLGLPWRQRSVGFLTTLICAICICL